jgi:hypothetical protein
MEDEDDEETREWEMAQAQRAGGWKEEPEKPVKASYHPTLSEPSIFRRDDADLQCRPLALCLR